MHRSFRYLFVMVMATVSYLLVMMVVLRFTRTVDMIFVVITMIEAGITVITAVVMVAAAVVTGNCSIPYWPIRSNCRQVSRLVGKIFWI